MKCNLHHEPGVRQFLSTAAWAATPTLLQQSCQVEITTLVLSVNFSCLAMHSVRKDRAQKQEFRKDSKLVHRITLHLKAEHQDSGKHEKNTPNNLQWE